MKKILGAVLLMVVILSPLACGKNLSPTSANATPTATFTPTITPQPGLTWTGQTLPSA